MVKDTKNKILADIDCMAAYESMLLIRRFEEKCASFYSMGKIGGFCHLYIGQEALVVGMQHVASKTDSIITTYRDHGHMLAAGMDPKGVLAELFGRGTGYSKGKGGSMHMFSVEKNFYGGHGIVGANVPLGTGLGFAHQYKKDNGVCHCYFGDGAANQGQVVEAFNIASLWNLPVLYIIENNQYAMGTSTARHTANTDFSLRGVPYNIESEKVDGLSIFDVVEKGGKALTSIKENKSPFLLDVWTYRYKGHSMSDPGKYRVRDEIEDIKNNRDCILTLEKYILDNSIAKESDLKDINKKIKSILQEAEKFATDSSEPELEELYTDITV